MTNLQKIYEQSLNRSTWLKIIDSDGAVETPDACGTWAQGLPVGEALPRPLHANAKGAQQSPAPAVRELTTC